MGWMGFERPLRKHAGGMFLGRGRIHGKPTTSRRNAGGFSFLMHRPARLCIVSTYRSFAIKVGIIGSISIVGVEAKENKPGSGEMQCDLLILIFN